MDDSFLTFSPKALLRKKTASKNAPNSQMSKLAKSKIFPLQDTGSPSNFKNITKSNRSSGGSRLEDSSIIILDDSVCNNEKKLNSISCITPVASNHKLSSAKINTSKQINNTIVLEDSPTKEVVIKHNTLILNDSTPDEKFEKIKEWLDELHNIHQKKMYQPVWSTPVRSETCSLNSTISSISKESSLKLRISETSSSISNNNNNEPGSVLETGDNSSKEKSQKLNISSVLKKSSMKLRISETSSNSSEPTSVSKSKKNLSKENGDMKWKGLERNDEENTVMKPTLHRKLTILSSESESDSHGNNSLTYKLKTKLKIISSDSDSNSDKSLSCSASNSVSSSGSDLCLKYADSLAHQIVNSRSDSIDNAEEDEIKQNDISESSVDRLCSEVYGDSWDKENVMTPKPGRRRSSTIRKVPRKSSSSINDLLNNLYGNSWCEDIVLTPLSKKSKTRIIRGKENTPPFSEKPPKVKRKIVKHNVCLSNPGVSPGNVKAVKSTKGVKVASTTPSSRTLSFLRSLSASPSPNACNPRAVLYKKEFKKHREALCQELFKLFNSEVFENKLPSAMRIEWNVHMTRSAGFCFNSWVLQPGGKVRSSRIELSTKVCNTADRVRDTLIHEMCHAATWVINGVKNGHGSQWKAWTLKAMKKFPELPFIGRCHSYNIETKFMYKCKSCGYSIGRHSKSLDLQRKRCGYCYGEFELFVNSKPRKAETGIPSTPRTPRAATGFALFVKQNYKITKETNSGLSHAEIMKLLGSQFSSVKESTKQ